MGHHLIKVILIYIVIPDGIMNLTELYAQIIVLHKTHNLVLLSDKCIEIDNSFIEKDNESDVK